MIIQWNIRGLRANYKDLEILCKEKDPSAICLQETMLQEKINISLTKYNILRKDSKSDSANGGVALFINQSFLFSEVALDTPLQAVAARVSLHKTITICSLYLPPGTNVNKQDLVHLISQLPPPYIIMGDFNGHSPLWGSNDVNTRGQIIQSVFEELDACLFNNGSPTYVNATSHLPFHLDLTVCDPTLLLDFEWTVHDDLCGSDHFPIFLIPIETNLENKAPRGWNLKKANWAYFQSLCKEQLSDDSILNSDDPALVFSDTLLKIAEQSVPRMKQVKNQPRNPWFNKECKTLQKRRKTAQRRAFSCPTQENVMNYKKLRAKARYTFKQSKKQSWKQYVSSLTSKTPSAKVWKAIRKIKGKGGTSSISHLRVGNNLITDKVAVSNLIAETISENSSAKNYCAQFQKIKATEESKPCNFQSNNSEDYNVLFSLQELKLALQKSTDSATGLDGIHYQFLTHLPEESLRLLLSIFNHIWTSGHFPESWRRAEIIPIPKQGKDLKDPNNYRPIALTSCVCKTMERLVNSRLVWCLETKGLLTDLQCGFRQGRSTIDHLVRFETFIREAFVKKQHVLAIFFDLEKAYDRTWKHGILKDLETMGFRGYLPIFIERFLDNRSFTVRVGSANSDFFKQEMGVPQGSILSPTLFSIKMNNIVESVKPGTNASLFVDDFALCARGATLHHVERQLQLCVNNVQSWVSENGFKFSPTKTVCVHYTKQRGPFPNPEIKLQDTNIKVATEAKFLGVIFDQKMTFESHINQLKHSCQKALDVLKVVGHTDWGADRTVLLRLYRSLGRSKLDYACIVWGSACKSYLQVLNTIHHQGLRISLGAFRTSPVESLYVETGEPSLKTRRKKLSMNYVLKLKSNPKNPAYDCVFNPKSVEDFENNPSVIPPLSLRARKYMQEADIDIKQIGEVTLCDIPPWNLHEPEVYLELSTYKKSETSAAIYQQHLNELLDTFKYFKCIYTDGSKSEDGKVAAAAVSKQTNQAFKHRLVDHSSIYSAELQAILLALKHIYQSKEDNFIILSDSLSALQALKGCKLDHPFLIEIRKLHTYLLNDNKDVIFIWVPSHIGIRGNEKADLAANEARQREVDSEYGFFADFKALIHKHIKQTWQAEWEGNPNNKLFKIVPNISDCIPRCRTNRKEETVLSRLHIGHSYFTHSYLLKRTEQPYCYACDSVDTIEHILISCADFIHIREKYYDEKNLKDLFNNTNPDRIFQFLKEINLFYKI